jgi:hypothetical protein
VRARQHDLEELRVGELAELLGVEELDEVITVCFARDLVAAAVLSEEVEEVERLHVAVLVAVEATERRVRLEVSIGAQELSEHFEDLLLARDRQE